MPALHDKSRCEKKDNERGEKVANLMGSFVQDWGDSAMLSSVPSF